MQDRDIPPEAEGKTNGAEDGVRLKEDPEAREALWAATANRDRVSTQLRWITATAPTWAATMAGEDRAAPASARPMLLWSQSLCLLSMKMPPPASLLSWKICSSSPRFRRLAAR